MGRRVVHRLRELKIAQEGQFGEFALNLLREGVIVFERRSLHSDIDRCWRPETHDLADDVAGFKRDLQIGQSLPQSGPNAFAERVVAFDVFPEANPNNSLLGACGEKVDQVDGIAGRLRSEVIAGDGDVVWPNGLFDDVNSFQNHRFGLLDTRAGGSAQTNLEQRGPNIGKNFGSHAGKEEPEESE